MLTIIPNPEVPLLQTVKARFTNDVRLQKVSSSWIKAVGYNVDHRTLYLMTKEEGERIEQVYPYFGVDAQTYAEFMEAPSKGKFYNAHLRGRFKWSPDWRRVDFPAQTNMHRVRSSWIKAVGYNVDHRTLYLMTQETKNALPRLYPYFDISAEEFARLMNAKSKGEYYNTHIKNRYVVERII